MTVFTEPNNLKDFLVWEQERYKSRKEVTFLSGESISLGEVVGKITLSCPATGTAGTNTGAGTCSGVTAGAMASLGTYTLTCVATATGGGTFKVVAPDGGSLPDAVVGTAYTNQQINFTINDGDPDFAAGDSFTIPITAGSGKYVEVDASAVDGFQRAAGIAIADYDASGGDLEGVVIAQDAIITTSNLIFPAGATNGQKTAWLNDLASLRIDVIGES